MVPFTSLPDFNVDSKKLFAAQVFLFRSVKTLMYSYLLLLTASKVEMMRVLGLTLTTVSVYRSPSTMATSALAKSLGFWLAQMPTSVCSCPCV